MQKKERWTSLFIVLRKSPGKNYVDKPTDHKHLMYDIQSTFN